MCDGFTDWFSDIGGLFVDPSGEWTAHKVELVVWTDVMARKLDPTLLESVYSEDTPTAGASGESKTKNRRSKSVEGRDSKRSKTSKQVLK